MNSSAQYKLVDEITDLEIPSNYDPLLKNPFEEYIRITERANPGKRPSFNNIPDQATRDIHVSGLVLNWSDNLSNSKLRAALERGNIENLYLYADTVVVGTLLRFPQTNVTIYARRLIMGDKGKIDTTPTPFAQAYAQGQGSPKGRIPNPKTNSGVSDDQEESWWPYNDPFARENPVPPDERPKYPTYRGEDGASAGDINLFVKTHQLRSTGPCLLLKGSDGQHGEKGGVKERVTSSDVPVSWEKVLGDVLDFDTIRGSESSWAWAADMKKELQAGDVYYAKVGITNVSNGYVFKPKEKTIEYGNGKIANLDSGLDAYAAGDGGNGGNGGTVRVINPSLSPKVVDQTGGKKGVSEQLNGSAKSKDSTKLRKIYNVCHRSAPNADQIAGMKFGARELQSRAGYSAKGQDGVDGKDGGFEVLSGQEGNWLHPYLLKTVVQYAKDAWLAGDRRPARWLLTIYQAAFKEGDPKLLSTLAGAGLNFCLAWSPDGKVLATGSLGSRLENNVKLWEASTGKLLWTSANHAGRITSMTWSPDGKVLASGSEDQTVKLWKESTGELLLTLPEDADSVYAVAWSPDGKVLASGSFKVKLWNPSTGKLLSTLPGSSLRVNSLAWSSDGKVLASSGDSVTLWRLWGPSPDKTLQPLDADSPTDVAWSPDGKVLASGSEDQTIKLWNGSTGELLSTLAGHRGRVNTLAWSPDGKVLASGSEDQTIKLWNGSTGGLVSTLPAHDDSVYAVAWNPDGKMLSSCSRDRTVKLWDALAVLVPSSPLPDDLVVTNLRHEIDVFLDKINDNLDYFGNPIGWVPRLSALTNLQMLKQSQSVIVQLLYYANNLALQNQNAQQTEDQLKFMIDQLTSQIDEARKDLVDGYNQLDAVKIECDAIQLEIGNKMSKVRELNDQITRELKNDAAQQAIFTGALKLAAGLLQVIPVGQPYLGGIGGGLLDNVSQIDIHSDNPLGQTFKTMSGVSKDLNTFIQTNKEKLTEDLTSPLTQQITSAQGAINTTDTFMADFKTKLGQCDQALKEKFGSELETLRDALSKIRSIKTKDDLGQRKQELEFVGTSEWISLYTEGEDIKERIKEIEDWNAPKKAKILSKISELETDKSALLAGLKGFQAKKEARTNQIKQATEFMNGVTKGIGGIGDGVQTMLTRVDESSEDFRKKIQQAQNAKFKSDFENLYAEIDKLNLRKLKAAQAVTGLEGQIQRSSQTISTNLVTITSFSNQRAEATEQQLTHVTKLFLEKVIQDTREFFLTQVYDLVKSYQYRFAEKVDGSIFDIQKIVDEIINFFTKNNTKAPDDSDYAKAFKAVLQGKLITLAKSLLTGRIQNMSLPNKNHYSVTFTPQTVRADGVNLLSELNRKKQVTFKLHELGKGDSKGSGEEFFYRIEKIVFKSIAFADKTPKQSISFSFGIKHSGDSIIRGKDGRYYYFTTRSQEIGPTDESAERNIMAWTANYNGDEAETENKGLTNTTVDETDWDIFKGLLTVLDTDASSVTYSQHLPGATSELTLFIDKNKLGVDFEITKLAFDFYYQRMI